MTVPRDPVVVCCPSIVPPAVDLTLTLVVFVLTLSLIENLVEVGGGGGGGGGGVVLASVVNVKSPVVTEEPCASVELTL